MSGPGDRIVVAGCVLVAAMMGYVFYFASTGDGAAGLPQAQAHSGGLSPKDGCHRHKAAGERRWHLDGTAQRGGECVKRDGIAYRVQEVEVPKVSAPCRRKLDWLVDGNGRFGGTVPIGVADLNRIADLCLGRPARE